MSTAERKQARLDKIERDCVTIINKRRLEHRQIEWRDEGAELKKAKLEADKQKEAQQKADAAAMEAAEKKAAAKQTQTAEEAAAEAAQEQEDQDWMSVLLL